MTYCTPQDMEKRFSTEEVLQLTDHDNDGVADAEVLDQAINDAAAEIDGYLIGRYSLPLAHVPSVLVRISCDIARFYLYDDQATDGVIKRYEQAIKFLMAVGKGQIALGPSDQGGKVETGDGAHIESAGNVFARPAQHREGGGW